MSQPNYNVPMTDEAFEDLKANAILLWQTYDNEYGYVDDKVSRIKDIQNVRDNGMYILAMFDSFNVLRLLGMVEADTRHQLEDGRLPESFTF